MGFDGTYGTKLAAFEIQKSLLELKPEWLFGRGAILAAQNLKVLTVVFIFVTFFYS